MYAIIYYRNSSLQKNVVSYTTIEPLLPILNVPLIEYQLDLFKKNGVLNIIVIVDKMAKGLKRFLKQYQENINVACFEEDRINIYETAKDFLGKKAADPFFVIDGKVLTDTNLNYILKYFLETNCDGVLGLKTAGKSPLHYGLDQNNRLIQNPDKHHKPLFESAGLGLFDGKLLRELLDGSRKSQNIFEQLLRRDMDVRGLMLKGTTFSVTTPSDYLKVTLAMLNRVFNSRLVDEKVRRGIFIAEDVRIEPGAVIKSPSIIGAQTEIKGKAVIGPYAVIGENCTIEQHSQIEEAVVMNHSIISKNIFLRRCIVDNLTKI